MSYPTYDLTFEQYQRRSKGTAIYPGAGTVGGLTYSALGLSGESGEVAEKVKKMLRDDGGELSDERREAIAKELGDVLWYVAAVARDAGLSLEEVATGNLNKLASRKARGVLQGSGDNR